MIRFIARDKKLRGPDLDSRPPIVLMFDEAAFNENPHDTVSLFVRSDKVRKLSRGNGVGARIVVLDAIVFVPAGACALRPEEYCEWLGWSHGKTSELHLDDNGEAADYKSGSGTMTGDEFVKWAEETCALVREIYGDYPVVALFVFPVFDEVDPRSPLDQVDRHQTGSRTT